MAYELPASFFNAIRNNAKLGFGKLTASQVKAFNDIYSAFVRYGDTDRSKLAYIMATARGEVGSRMQPVRETFAKTDQQAIDNLERAWKAGKLPSVKTPYWREGWFGRGYPQLTHKTNYEKMSKEIGIDLVINRDALLRSDIAAAVMVIGMMKGLFTGKKLSDYSSFVSMRAIVNGSDRAQEIASYAVEFWSALQGVAFPIGDIPIPAPIDQEKENMIDYSKLVGWALRMLLIIGGTGGAAISDGDIQTITSAIVTVIGLVWSGATAAKK